MAAPIRPGGIPAGAVALPTDPVVLKQQRQILALQQQVLAMQIQQQQQATKHLEAKVPLVRVQLEELNRREAIIDGQIATLQHYINGNTFNISSIERQLEEARNSSISWNQQRVDALSHTLSKGGQLMCPGKGKSKFVPLDPKEREQYNNHILAHQAQITALQQNDYTHKNFKQMLKWQSEIAPYKRALRDLENLQHEKTELRNKKIDLENQIQTFLRQ